MNPENDYAEEDVESLHIAKKLAAGREVKRG
jgi:hypothetical protein